ncbi:MAG: rhomboid family intramembrane serine protease [Solirubrobacteraceae bacterium]|nr:rhomboid family intramembrane serine protease [Solirubrobacteraceae bacterium]
MSSPDLFVVCKSCGSEVSPYVTECPYCGTRLRKRAPKIERDGGVPKPPKPPRFGRKPRQADSPRLSKLRAGEIPGIRAERTERPWATILLVALSLGVWLSLVFVLDADLMILSLSGDPWRFVTAPFVNTGTGAQFAAVVGIGLYGWLLERRIGPVGVIVIFFLCGTGGLVAAEALGTEGALFGSQGASLGLLAAWTVPQLINRRRGYDDESDLLGTAVIAVVLLVAPWGSYASVLAGVIGGLIGALCGLIIATARR